MSFFKTVFKKVFKIPSKSVTIEDDKKALINLFKSVAIVGDLDPKQVKAIREAVLLTGIAYYDTMLTVFANIDICHSHAYADRINLYTGSCNLLDLKYVLIHELRHVQQFASGDLKQVGDNVVFKGQIVDTHPVFDNALHIKRPQEIDANLYAISMCGPDGYFNGGVLDIVEKTLALEEEKQAA